MSLLRRLITTCALALLAAHSAAAFEGQITMKMMSGKDSMPITYYVKDTKLRMEFTPADDKRGKNSGTFAMIVDWKTLDAMMLMAEQKMYMVHKLPDMSKEGDKQAGKDEMTFKPTGKKEKIAGYEAEEYVGTSEGKRTELWVTKGLGNFMMANQAKGGGAFGKGKQQTAAWEKFMREGDFFALRIIQRKKENAPEEFRMEVTNVDKVPQADALFRAPADFQKLEMPNMGGMLKGLIPGQ